MLSLLTHTNLLSLSLQTICVYFPKITHFLTRLKAAQTESSLVVSLLKAAGSAMLNKPR